LEWSFYAYAGVSELEGELMAKLKKCRHCGHMIAKKADKCPNCGGKNKRTSLFTKFVAAGFCVIAIMAYLGGKSRDSSKREESTSKIDEKYLLKHRLNPKVVEYKRELNKAQTICNSLIQKKYPRLRRVPISRKNILLGYKDGELGQHGFKGSGKKAASGLAKDIKFRWTWSLGSGSNLKCLIMRDDTYSVKVSRL
jgi:hypothetical protein